MTSTAPLKSVRERRYRPLPLLLKCRNCPSYRTFPGQPKTRLVKMSAPIPLAFFRSSREGGASAAWQTSYNNVVSASGMSSPSPTAEGFRLIFRRPAIPFAEIAWRWSFVAAMWFLGAMFLVQYADSLTVTRLERLMLGTNQPVLVLRAIHRIFQGSAFRFTKAAVLVAIALTIAWIVLASLGRAVTVRALTDEFRIASPHGPG